jgi:hypothetical protein
MEVEYDMKRLMLGAALVCSAGAMTLGAQQPGPRIGPGAVPGAGMMGGGGALEDPAQFLLAHTGEFSLTDAQVTRLAAIARRSAERRRSLRAQMDSLRPQQRDRGARPDSAARAQMRQQMQQRFDQMRPAMQKLRDQAQADRRDAIAVLTPDQQALAWERIAASGRMRRAGVGRGMGRGFGRRRGGFGGGPMPGARLRGRGMAPGMGPGRMRAPNDDAGAGADRPRPRLQRRPDEQLNDR